MTKPESPPVESGPPSVADAESRPAKKAFDLRKFGAHTVPPGVRAEIAGVPLPSMPADRFKDTLPPSDAVDVHDIRELREPAKPTAPTTTRSGLGPAASAREPRLGELLSNAPHEQPEATSPAVIRRPEPKSQQRVVSLRAAIAMVLFAVSLVMAGFVWFSQSMNQDSVVAKPPATAASEVVMAATPLPSAPAPASAEVAASPREGATAAPAAPQEDLSLSRPKFKAEPKRLTPHTDEPRTTGEPRTTERKRRALYDSTPE